jgi:hypothetical protein
VPACHWLESEIKTIQSAQGKIFEKNCQETRQQKEENQKAEKVYGQQETNLQQNAAETKQKLMTSEAYMLLQAQLLLDQLPMDMGAVKEELDT